MASYLHRTAQPPTLAAFRPWGSSAGAGRIRLAAANIGSIKGRKKRQDEFMDYSKIVFNTKSKTKAWSVDPRVNFTYAN